ncbi:MAG: lasso peptide biosynthesis B2 protein [Acidobacteria bacterium]|nr:lasso peptide biosynthesis B2 protein [Acidobacteriota bacterium]
MQPVYDALHFLKLSRGEKLIVLRAFFLLPLVSVVFQFRKEIWRKPLQESITVLKKAQGSRNLPRAQRIAALVRAAKYRLPFQITCLSESVVVYRLLQKQGISSRVRLGVTKGAEGLQAHAWVEHDGVCLAPAGAHECFSTLESLPVAEG